MELDFREQNMEKPPQDAVSIFRETAKDRGKLNFHPHEAYEEELEESLS